MPCASRLWRPAARSPAISIVARSESQLLPGRLTRCNLSRMVRRRAALLVLFVLVVAASATAQPPDLDAWVARTMQTFEVPGISLAVVKDDGGVVVFDRDGYASQDSARKSVGVWVRKNYADQLAPGDTYRTRPVPPPVLGHQLVVADLAAEMEMKADDQDATAVGLRQQADRLEAEAKRLRSAADVLRGPDGDR